MQHKIYSLILPLLASYYLVAPSTTYTLSLKKLSSLFGAYSYLQSEDLEYEIVPEGSLFIKNDYGNITITSEWTRKKTVIKVAKKAKSPEFLSSMRVKEQTSPEDRNALVLVSEYAHNAVRGSMDYTVIIPASIPVHLETDTGSIIINECSGPVYACTRVGDIKICNTKGAVHAFALRKGSLFIGNAEGPIEAECYKGSVTIEKSHNSINIHNKKGPVSIVCSQLPTAGLINVESASGAIQLELPDTISACLSGKAHRGILTCTHPIVLKPQKTTLDLQAWKKFKKEVEGTFGTGDATINLVSCRGNIKIMKSIAKKNILA